MASTSTDMANRFRCCGVAEWRQVGAAPDQQTFGSQAPKLDSSRLHIFHIRAANFGKIPTTAGPESHQRAPNCSLQAPNAVYSGQN